MANVIANREQLLADLQHIVSAAGHRTASLQNVADMLRDAGNFRWVGLYDVNHARGMVTNIVWSGPGAPKYPTFPLTNGLTGHAVSNRKTINVGDVAVNPRYLTAFGTTRSEIIVPVLDQMDGKVVGTIDVESDKPNAFSDEVQGFLETCSDVIRPLWPFLSPKS
jgi:GAF domain-containing protein